MKLTIKDLVLFYNLYDQIKDRAPSIKTAYKMNKIYERAAQEQTFIQEQQQKIAEKYGITYYDFNFEADKIGIDWNVDTRDGGNHLNSRGADKLTNYVGKIFADNYGLPDHRKDEAYKSWDEAYEKYADIIKEKK